MSYKDLKEVQTKRAKKEIDKVKKKEAQGQKHKSPTLEPEEVIIDKIKRSKKRKYATPGLDIPEPKTKVAQRGEAPER